MGDRDDFTIRDLKIQARAEIVDRGDLMDDLPTWLRAQIDERETKIKARPEVHVAVADLLGDRLDVFAYGQTERRLLALGLVDSKEDVLREVEAKRRQVDWCVEVIGDRDLSRYGEPGALKDDRDALAVTLAVEQLKLLALPYADRPGYREGWRP
ncbi:DUF6221 family protein [Amycolatopsis sp. NPDC004772]